MARHKDGLASEQERCRVFESKECRIRQSSDSESLITPAALEMLYCMMIVCTAHCNDHGGCEATQCLHTYRNRDRPRTAKSRVGSCEPTRIVLCYNAHEAFSKVTHDHKCSMVKSSEALSLPPPRSIIKHIDLDKTLSSKPSMTIGQLNPERV